MYKDDYISAFGKLAPSEEWMTDTLAKMRAAEAEQEAPGAAGPAGRPALRVSGKKHQRLRRAALPVAAAVALLVVPAAWFWGVAMRRRAAPPRAVQPAERRGRGGRGPGDGTGAPRGRSAGHSGHGKLCGGSAGDNGGRAGRRAQGGQAAVRRGRRRYGHGRYYRPDGCGPGGREPHL